MTTMEIKPLSDALGTEISGVDVSTLSNAEFARVYDLWIGHCVLVFRNQDLSPQSLIEFSRRFGDLEMPPSSEKGSREEERAAVAPEMWIISNVVENGRPIGALGSGEAFWHTDMSYLPNPPTASILYGHEVPASGSSTWYGNMYAAIEQMPASLRARIEGLEANHDSSYTAAGELRKGAQPVQDVRSAPGAHHPIIRPHPETGRETLYLGRRLNGYVLGLPLEESESLLNMLWDWCSRPQFTYEHKWQRGDLVVWDNRATTHRRAPFNADERRIMWRCQVKSAQKAAVAA